MKTSMEVGEIRKFSDIYIPDVYASKLLGETFVILAISQNNLVDIFVKGKVVKGFVDVLISHHSIRIS
jgi:hypothetical protein